MRLMVIAIVLLSGCSSMTTYPPVETDVAMRLSRTEKEPTQTIMAKSISYAHDHFGGMDTIVFNLPAGVGEPMYSAVADKLHDAIPMTMVGEPAYHIIELRIRGFEAEADVVFPSAPKHYLLATLHLNASIIDPWEVTYDRVWEIPVEQPPLPNLPALYEHDFGDTSP